MGLEFFHLFWALGFILFCMACSSLKFVNEYDRLVVFRFGRVTGVRGPGPVFIIPLIERFKKVDTRMVTMPIPIQEIITRDNVSAKTAAVCFFSVVDPYKVITKIEDPYQATSQIAQTTLRSVCGQHELDDLLAERDLINAKLQAMIDRQTEGWGIKVNAVEVKDVEIPEGMRRAIGRQAEAERERRAKIVAAEGEMQAAEKLSQAAALINSQAGAMQLRQLQTMVEIASEGKHSTMIFPIPVELMSAVGQVAPALQKMAGNIASSVTGGGASSGTDVNGKSTSNGSYGTQGFSTAGGATIKIEDAGAKDNGDTIKVKDDVKEKA